MIIKVSEDMDIVFFFDFVVLMIDGVYIDDDLVIRMMI